MEISIKWNLCRVCLTRDVELVNLFNDTKLVKQIAECTGRSLIANDGLPQTICTKCVDDLRIAHNFVSKFRKSDDYVKTIVQRTLSTTSEFDLLSTSNNKNDETIQADNNSQGGEQRQDAINTQKVTLNSLLAPIKGTTTNSNEKNKQKLEVIEFNEEVDAYVKGNFDNDNSTHSSNVSILEESTIEECNQQQDVEEQELVSDNCNCEDDCGENDIQLIKTSINSIQDDDDKSQNDYIIVVSEDKSKTKLEHLISDLDDKYMECMPNVKDNFQILNMQSSNAVYLMPDLNSIENLIEEEDDTRVNQQDLEIAKSSQSTADKADVEPDAIDDAECEEDAATEHFIKENFYKSKKRIDVSNFMCPICGNTFARLSLLKPHLRTHRGKKQYECELCAKKFDRSHNLANHMRIHTGQKPFKCQYCERAFTDRSTHIKHERIHTNEKPFSCHICGKCFSLSSTLKAHEAVHSDEKPYQKCNKSFKLPHQLKAHLATLAHNSRDEYAFL